MLKNLINIIKNATEPFTTFQVGVKVLENINGDDIYPLSYMELPILSTITETYEQGLLIENKIILYVVTQRIDKTYEEDIEQLDQMYNLTTKILANLSDKITNVSFITYNGIIDNQFSDDVNGVRIEFTITTTNSICN